MTNTSGNIIIPPEANVWAHELDTARALAKTGKNVCFIVRREGQHQTTPDIIFNGLEWEMKAPNGSSKKTIEKNIRRACEQSPNVVFDSKRLKGLPDKAVEQELRSCANGRVRELKHLVFVDRRRKVIDIM